MKFILSTLSLLFFFLSAYSQKFWVTSESGSSGGEGAILKSDDYGNTFYVIHYFDFFNGSTPTGNLCDAGNGKLYGITEWGGYNNNGGIVYSFDTLTYALHKIHDFGMDWDSGYAAVDGMIMGADGMLYGVTPFGGPGDFGVIYRVDPTNDTYSVLYNFDYYQVGANSHRLLALGADDKLYGLAAEGGTNGAGTLFSFDPTNNSCSDLHDFDFATGCNPRSGPLLLANDGIFYGTTLVGGQYDDGVLFSFDPVNNIYTVLHELNGTDGARPLGGMVQADNGAIYGTTTVGGVDSSGVMFKYDINAAQYSVVHQFDSSTGDKPLASLIKGSNGKLYGTTTYGCNSNGGAAFSYDVSADDYVKLFEFGSLECGWQGDLLETRRIPSEGIASLPSYQAISLFPSPAEDFVTLETTSKEITIKVFDLCGRMISLPVSFHNTKVELDVKNLAAGLYNLQITDNRSGKVEVGKFVKSVE